MKRIYISDRMYPTVKSWLSESDVEHKWSTERLLVIGYEDFLVFKLKFMT